MVLVSTFMYKKEKTKISEKLVMPMSEKGNECRDMVYAFEAAGWEQNQIKSAVAQFWLGPKASLPFPEEGEE